MYIPDLEDTKERKPIPIEDIRKIQSKCRSSNDELRWIIAIISDTGMRLAEAVGLKAEDIILNSNTPHILLKVILDINSKKR